MEVCIDVCNDGPFLRTEYKERVNLGDQKGQNYTRLLFIILLSFLKTLLCKNLTF